MCLHWNFGVVISVWTFIPGSIFESVEAILEVSCLGGGVRHAGLVAVYSRVVWFSKEVFDAFDRSG